MEKKKCVCGGETFEITEVSYSQALFDNRGRLIGYADLKYHKELLPEDGGVKCHKCGAVYEGWGTVPDAGKEKM